MNWTARCTVGVIALGCMSATWAEGLLSIPIVSASSPILAVSQLVDLTSVRGTKWLDSNGDGARDSSEPGLPGVTIYLDLNDNGQLDMGEPLTVTMVNDSATAADEGGLFWFVDLPPGRYAIREVVPDGFVQTFPANEGAHFVELESGQVVEGLDFGNALRDRRLSLCHKGRVITVDRHSVPAHLRHRDRLVATGANACGSNGD